MCTVGIYVSLPADAFRKRSTKPAHLRRCASGVSEVRTLPARRKQKDPRFIMRDTSEKQKNKKKKTENVNYKTILI